MNNTVLVTGSSRGIGKEIAIRLANEGYSLVVHYVKNERAAHETAEMIKKVGSDVRLLQCDVSDREQCRKVITEDVEHYGPYYGVVCNAGVTADVAFPAMTEQQWDKVVHTNLDGFYNVLQPLIMPMISARKGGRIVTLASVSGIIGNRGQVNYSASKAGVIGATKALALELAKRKITVNCVAPGLIDTDILDDHVPIEEIKKMIPLKRMGTAKEVAGTVAFLFSKDAAYITRQVISVNGGLA